MVIRKIIMYHVCFVDTENNEIVAVKIFDRFSKAENYLEQQNAIPIMGDGDYYNIDGKVYFISADSIEEIEGVKGWKDLFAGRCMN